MKARVGGGKALGHYDAARSTEYGTPTVELHDQIYHSGPKKAWTMAVEHRDPDDRRRTITTIAGAGMFEFQCISPMWYALA